MFQALSLSALSINGLDGRSFNFVMSTGCYSYSRNLWICALDASTGYSGAFALACCTEAVTCSVGCWEGHIMPESAPPWLYSVSPTCKIDGLSKSISY